MKPPTVLKAPIAMLSVAAFLLGVVLCTAVRIAAQGVSADHPEPYPAADVAVGARVYNSVCVNCHGPSGTGVGGIDLRRGLLPRARTDAELQAVITSGFPQSGMPALHLDPGEVRGVIAYIRTGLGADDGSTPIRLGDAARGQALVEGKGRCLTCHRVNDKGDDGKGPDLSDVGRARVPASILRSLTNPSSSMRPINRPVRAVTRDGRTITGRRLNEDTYTVQLIDDQGRLVSLVKTELRDWNVSPISPMPSYQDTLTADELADLVAYLVTLKGSR